MRERETEREGEGENGGKSREEVCILGEVTKRDEASYYLVTPKLLLSYKGKLQSRWDGAECDHRHQTM